LSVKTFSDTAFVVMVAILKPMRTALVIPSLGASHLETCLEAVARLDPAPDTTMVVLSGGANPPSQIEGLEVHQRTQRLGFAAAVNTGISALPDGVEAVGVLNDDATPEPRWFGALVGALERDPGLASVQGTVMTAHGTTIDGRGIVFDRYGLPVQIDHGAPIDDDRGERSLLAVSGTACLHRFDAISQASLSATEIFDERFDCYHEDLDLGLRLHRLGWRSRWIGGARAAHLGSASGPSLRWRHPWWVLINRWRALAGNFSRTAFLALLPRVIRGEVRAVHTLGRTNWRVLPVAAAVIHAVPFVVVGGWLRKTSGARLEAIPENPA
jgi:GT2 family glycosyltransferase